MNQSFSSPNVSESLGLDLLGPNDEVEMLDPVNKQYVKAKL